MPCMTSRYTCHTHAMHGITPPHPLTRMHTHVMRMLHHPLTHMLHLIHPPVMRMHTHVVRMHVTRMHTHVFTRVHGITPPPSHAYAYACDAYALRSHAYAYAGDAYAHACARAFTGMHTYAFDAITHVSRACHACAHAMHDITLYVSHACHAWHHATTPSHAYAYACDAYAASPSHVYAASPSHAYAYACDGYAYACAAYACACVHTRSRHHANHPLTRIHAYASCVHTRSRHHANHPLTRLHTHVMRMHTHVLTRSRVCIHTHLMPSRM